MLAVTSYSYLWNHTLAATSLSALLVLRRG